MLILVAGNRLITLRQLGAETTPTAGSNEKKLRAIANKIVELATQAIAEIDVSSEDLAPALQRYEQDDSRSGNMNRIPPCPFRGC